MDWGWKSLLRGYTKCLTRLFNGMLEAKGLNVKDKYRWSDAHFFAHVETFLKEFANIKKPTRKEVLGTGLLLYSTKYKTC